MITPQADLPLRLFFCEFSLTNTLSFECTPSRLSADITMPTPFRLRSLLAVVLASATASLSAADLPPGPAASVPSGGKAPGDYPNFTVTGANWTMDASAVPDIGGGLRDEIKMNLAGQGPLPWSLTAFGQGRFAPRLNVADPQAAATKLDALPFDLIIDGTSYEWENDIDPWAANGAAWRPHPAKGILLATVRKNSQMWNDGAPLFYGVVSTPIELSGGEGYSLIDGSFGDGDAEISVGKLGPELGGAIDTSVAWFPYDQGWIGGHVASADFEQGEWIQDGFHHPELPADPADMITWSRELGIILPPVTLSLPNVNARTDGMLFTSSIERASTNNHLTSVDPKTDGSGWDIMIRPDTETDPTFAAESALSFSFLYIPYSSGNLTGGHIRGSDASVLNGRGNYTIERLAEGRYQLAIPGKKASDGMLILNAAGRIPGNTQHLSRGALSYEANASDQFIIESHTFQGGNSFPLEDTDFYFAWIDFARPLSPPGFETVIDPPTITQQPESTNLELGGGVTLRVSASGSEPFIYQWLFDGNAIAGATEASFEITNARLEDAGSYTVEITNGGGKASSEAALVRVLAPPSISSQPQSLEAAVGDSVRFSVTASGTPPLTYQWQKDGVDIPGANAAELLLNNISIADAGQYRARVNNDVSEVFSTTGRLTVQAILTQPSITQHPQSVEVQAGNAVHFQVTATGTPPLRYQWQRNQQDIPGATAATFTLTNPQPSDSGAIRVLVSNDAGSTTSNVATLSVTEAPVVIDAPTIVQQPVSQTVNIGDSVRFQVVATGESIQYQWQANGTDIPGATQSALALSGVMLSAAGNYQVRLTNPGGSITSAVATLTVQEAPPAGDSLSIVNHPQAQSVAPGDSVTFSVVAESANPISYQWQLGTFNIPGARAASFSIDQVQQVDEGNYRVIVSDGTTTLTSNAASLTVSTAPVITQHPQSQTITEGDRVEFSVSAQGQTPLSYQWQFNGSNIPGARGQQFSFNSVQKADEGNYQVVVTDAGGSTTSEAAILSVTPRPDTPTLTITQISLNGNTLTIEWAGGPGIVLQAMASLSDPNWQDVPGTEGQNSTQQLALGLSAYFRLIQR